MTYVDRHSREPPCSTSRVAVDGRFLVLDGRTWRARGVTYGSFRARDDGALFPEHVQVKRDFGAMFSAGLNTIRTYTAPPPDLMELAGEFGLRIIAGLHYADWRDTDGPRPSTRRRVTAAGLEAARNFCSYAAGDPAVLAVSIGNEVPADLVRLHGIASVAGLLGDIAAEIHSADPDMLVTYSNFPTTEFLEIEGLDLVSFNVFLERAEEFDAYLKHLMIVADDRPLLVTELGLASDIHGQEAQAALLASQLRLVDERGLAGATVFSWTDEWAVDDMEVSGWGFGITTVERRPKPALQEVTSWAHRAVGQLRAQWPTMSVIVCAYNEQATIGECLASLANCSYPGLEVIVCDDGSTDATVEIAAKFPFHLLKLAHGGLSAARNAGLAFATGEFVAYLDADAACHREWPFHLVLAIKDDAVAAVGGPNLPYTDVDFVERVIADCPGQPTHVLVADDRAEHVPGCNMAFRRSDLLAIGGFNAAYTSAGDDVDVCWKLLDRGRLIAFAPAAQVRHHRRSHVRAYLRQQRGYGRAERMLTGAHPHRFNRLRQMRWNGFIYGGARLLPTLLRPVVYHGYQGSALFRPVERRRSEIANMRIAAMLPLTALPALVGLSLAAWSLWWLLLAAAPVAFAFGYGIASAAAMTPPRGEPSPRRFRLLGGSLHVVQPFVRTWGRIRGAPLKAPVHEPPSWTGDRVQWLTALRHELHASHCGATTGGAASEWDLRATVGAFLAADVTTAISWGWIPRHRVRFRARPALLLAASMAAVLLVIAPIVGLFTLAIVLAAAGIEALVLWSRVGRAVRTTTRGARS